jgi:uncharacterized membrane protein
MAVIGLGFSLYLTRVEKYVLEVFCVYCVVSLGIITVLAVASLWWAFTGPPAPRRS